MRDWTSGYVTDVGYTQGFYRELTPSLLNFVGLVAGIKTPGVVAPLTYCELGCGQGFSANLIAAANPHIQVYANDFNPTHIAGARALAAESGSSNVHFSDASFAEYLDAPELPAFDIIVIHGIFSWISPENRAHIISFLRDKLKVGGLVFVSYNSMPGWGMVAPLRHLLYSHGQITGGPTLGRIAPAFAFIEKLKSSDARYFRPTGMTERLEETKRHDSRYLAHEYLNSDWNVFYSSKIAEEMAGAKLHFVTGAHLPERLDNITLTSQQRDLMAEISDPTLRETVRDYIQNQQFRRDVFAKGALRLPRQDLDEGWLGTRFALTTIRDENELKVTATVGDVQLKAEIYEPILNRIADGPRTLRELLADATIAGLAWPVLREALTLLTGYNRISPALDATGDSARAKRTALFNAAVLRRAHSDGDWGYLASPITGGGVAIGRLEQLLLLGRLAKDPDPIAYAQRALAVGGERIIIGGVPVVGEEAARAELGARDAKLQSELPLLKQLRVL
jgi:SAM-dependent methyltransferase